MKKKNPYGKILIREPKYCTYVLPAYNFFLKNPFISPLINKD